MEVTNLYRARVDKAKSGKTCQHWWNKIVFFKLVALRLIATVETSKYRIKQ